MLCPRAFLVRMTASCFSTLTALPPLQFYDAHELAWGMFFRDGRTGAKWMCPAIINAFCMPWKDYTQLRMGVENGDAFRVRTA